ncbi:WAT1-related protein At3g30340 [Vitis vinifera]|uniref:WAT1-related protein n=1 Tax=Vitis vinifera TaxID=29760 RepID=F6HG99_VITVI|nr:WAT1-related protein At3g30340 [Vitis vinifera]|eukprot:XP_002272105.2 PREDICTED: WAT1-related protein At3g30340 [Vitis vinifera]
MNCHGQLKAVAAMVAVNFGLSVANVLIKMILDQGANHLVVITYRQSISTVFISTIAFFLERKSRPKLTFRILCHIFASALLGATLTQYFFLLGLKYTSASFSCAFINLVPAITFILSLVFKLEKVNLGGKCGRAKVLGTFICIGGALLLGLYRGMPLTNPAYPQAEIPGTSHAKTSISSHRTKSWATGSMVLTAASLTWSSWFLLQAGISKKYPCQYSSTAIMSFFSATQAAILSSILDRDLSLWILKGKLEISTVIFAGIVGSGLCYVLMSWCVNKKGPVFTAAFTPFIQIFVAIFDFSILHEQIHLGSVLGSILVIAGLYILLWGKSKEEEDCVMKQSQVAEEDPECDMAPQVVPITGTQ